jgi:hypothetical protein
MPRWCGASCESGWRPLRRPWPPSGGAPARGCWGGGACCGNRGGRARAGRRRERGLRPRVAARSRWQRVAALQRNRDFIDAYRAARMLWRAGLPAVFPPGTYWLARFANVTVAAVA